MKRSHLLSTLCAMLFALSHSSHAATIAMSTFDSNLDGWTSNIPTEISWSSIGGNPGGYARHEDSTGNATFLLAPSSFLGDWSSLNGTGTISFDHKIFSAGTGINNFVAYQVAISGPDGSAIWLGSTPNQATDWLSITAPIVETSWSVTGTWLDILSNVDTLQIRIELVANDGNDISGLDNIQLSSVPIPAAVWLFGSGLIGLIGFARRKSRV